MKRIGITLLTIVVFTISSSQISVSAVTPGAKCSKAGLIQLYGGKKYSCIKLGKKLYWDNGTVVTNSKNSPTPAPVVTNMAPQGSTTLREISLIEGQVTDWAMGTDGNLSVTVLIRWSVSADPNRAGFKIYYQNSTLGKAPTCDLKVASCLPASLVDPTVYEYSVNDPDAKTISIQKVRGYSLEAFKVCAIAKNSISSTNESKTCSTGMVNTLAITSLPKPKLSSTDVVRDGTNLKVTWQGLDTSGAPYKNTFKRINVYVKNNSEGNPRWVGMGFINSPGDSFRMPINASSYSVRITVISTLGDESSWSDEYTIAAYVPTVTAPGS